MNQSKKLYYFTVGDLININRKTVEEHGGKFGVRDQGLLESAASQPMQLVFGQDLHPTVADKAAAYLYHLAQNHPFEDGNKRIALAAADGFCRLNGYDLGLTNEEAEHLTLEVASGQLNKAFLREILAHKIKEL